MHGATDAYRALTATFFSWGPPWRIPTPSVPAGSTLKPPARRYKQGAEVAGNPIGFQAAKTADFRALALIFQGFEHGEGAFLCLAWV